jgi:iron complex outermembrane receptor protein
MKALLGGAAVSALSVGAALAQAAPQPAAKGEATTLQEVVVTGTLLRGVAPGAEVVAVDDKAIQATGALTANQVLATIPQVSNQFANLPIVGTTTTSQIQVQKPNLRDLPGGNTQTGNSTLILVDGHRITSAGVNQFAPDADVVPPSIVERVDVMPDGGSATYGTDAVGGVINFITKRRVEGVHMDVRGGFADHYNTINSNLTVGKAWDSGSAYLAWDFQHNTPLYTRFRDYSTRIDWNTGVPTGRQCDPPNISVGGVAYAYPGLVPGSVNACDLGKDGVIFPRVVRNSIFGGVSEDIGDRVKFDLRGFYTARDTESPGSPVRVSATATSANPFYLQVPGTPAGASQTIQFTLAPALGNTGLDTSKLTEWGIAPTVNVDVGHDWQVRTLLNAGGSHTTFYTASASQTLLDQYAGGSTVATAINPYNLAATPNRTLVDNIADFALEGESFVHMLDFRSVADGPLFSLPGGQVRLALGVEYLRNHLETRNNGAGSTLESFGSIPFLDYTQDVKSVFGEIQIPLVGPDNAMPGIHALKITASGRFDKYNDFGSTTNPKVGFNYEPVDWITLRGSWGTSFNAPTPVDQLGSLQNSVLIQNFFVPAPAGVTPNPGQAAIALLGAKPNLQPQTAKEYSIGADVRWPWVQGLKTSVSYYHIDYDGLLNKAPVFNPSIFFPNFPGFYIIHPTAAQITAAVSGIKGGLAQAAPYIADPTKAFEILDFRTANLGNAVLSGIDFSAAYDHPTDWGSFDILVSGNYEIKNQTVNPGSLPSDNLLITPALRLSSTFGANVGQLRAQLNLQHLASYRTVYSTTQPQDSIGSFNVVNLFFKYDLKGDGWRKDMSLSMNIDNLFDTDPPVYKLLGSNGYTNGSTLGRLVQFGVHKDF